METKTYYHLKGNQDELIDYNGKEVLVCKVNDEGVKRTVIPGFCEKYKYDLVGDNKDLPISEIKPITDESMQKDLEKKVVEKGYKDFIFFWD